MAHLSVALHLRVSPGWSAATARRARRRSTLPCGTGSNSGNVGSIKKSACAFNCGGGGGGIELADDEGAEDEDDDEDAAGGTGKRRGGNGAARTAGGLL